MGERSQNSLQRSFQGTFSSDSRFDSEPRLERIPLFSRTNQVQLKQKLEGRVRNKKTLQLTHLCRTDEGKQASRSRNPQI